MALIRQNPHIKSSPKWWRYAGMAEIGRQRDDEVVRDGGSAARGFAALFGTEAASLARASRVACMGENCAAAARAAGLPVDAVAAGGFRDLARVIASLLTTR